MAAKLASNFGFLGEHDEQPVRLGMLAEMDFPENECQATDLRPPRRDVESPRPQTKHRYPSGLL